MGNQRFEIAEPSLFPMGAFGFRSRYDRILMETNRSPLSEQVKRRLAGHVMRKLAGGASAKDAEDHGHASDVSAPPLKMVQLVRTVWPIGEAAMANPVGEWNPPPVTEVKGANRNVLGTYQLVAGKVVEIEPPRDLEAPRTTGLSISQKRQIEVPPPVPGSSAPTPVPWRKGPPPSLPRPGEPVLTR